MKILKTTPERGVRRTASPATLWLGVLCLFSIATALPAQTVSATLPTLDEALAAKQDVWGLAALRQPNGPSYEFFEKLLPPLRYVNARFRHYPIVLSAPNAAEKARLTSNGSGLNARADWGTWKEVGVPVTFHVGDDQHVFGEDLKKLDGPRLERGWLPIVQLRYEHMGKNYDEEAFAAVEPELATNGVVFVRFGVQSGDAGTVAAHLDAPGPWLVSRGTVQNSNGQTVAWFDESWQWVASDNKLVTRFAAKQNPTLAFATRPVAADARRRSEGVQSGVHLVASAAAYNKQRKLCVSAWQTLLDRAAQFEVPEPVVNNAWRAMLVNNFMLLQNDRPNYSWGNRYERLWAVECGDAALAFLLWGYGRDTVPMLSHLLDYKRPNLEFYNAGYKLQQIVQFYWLTRDTNTVTALRPKWEKEIQLIVGGRVKESGLAPREHYCCDIATRVHSLMANAGCWRGLRDFAAVLDDIGEREQARTLFAVATEFRAAILKAVEKSEYRDIKPPFVPMLLFGEEKPYEVLTSSKLGSYWNLIAPYVISSGVFGPPGVERERWMVDYLHEHGGICMGLVRFDQHTNLANKDALDDLYGLRYSIKLLQLDEVDRALVSFYGKLAQGLTRGTFIGAEVTSLRPLDEFGRALSSPPNSTAQAYALWMLRYLLVQDWDLDDDGRPETLRLGFGTPRRWLEDGKAIKIERAPTSFGPVSLVVQSRLSRGEVIAQLDLPARNLPKQTLLCIRVPDGWRVTSAKAGSRALKVDERGTVDVSSLKGKVTVRFRVAKT